jgi:hypothetical protein
VSAHIQVNLDILCSRDTRVYYLEEAKTVGSIILPDFKLYYTTMELN